MPGGCRARPRVWLGVALAAVMGFGASIVAAVGASPTGIAVEVANASEPVLCAEKDNVTINFTSDAVRRFRIEAAHPVYLSAMQRDSFAADWTACDMSGDPVHKSEVKAPTRRTLYEEPELWIVGWTMPTYWRPATATVRIGDRVEKGLHLIQVWMIRPMGGEEVLVLYPQDGYWRIRPKAPDGMAPTAFGSSFLVGPVEVEGRPIVKLREVAFSPATRTFTALFERGGSASLRMSTIDHTRHVLDVGLDASVSGRPFAVLRSMYVTDSNNDVARLALREPTAKGWREQAILTFDKARATDVWAGRTTISRHNTSSPDMIFSGFEATSSPAGKPER